MRHPDDEINERLRRALTDKFNSAQEQPDPALAHLVLNSIQRRTRNTMPYRLLLTAVLVLLTTIRPKEYAVHSPAKAKTTHTNRVVQATNENYSIEQESINKTPTTSQHLVKRKGNPVAKQAKHSEKGTAFPAQIVKNEQNEIANLNIKNESNATEVVAHSNVPNHNPEDPFLLDNSDFMWGNALKLPSISVPKESLVRESPKHAWHLLVEFTPMNTYQVVRIRNSQSVQYQNFEFPKSFSDKKIAYQFQTGVERNGLQLHIGYAFARQNFHYEVATNEFVLDKQNQVVRKGISEQVNNTLHFGNVGISKEITFNKARFRGYFIRVGADLSREFTTKQNVLWGTAAFGKEIPLGQGNALNIGPYLEYSLNKMRSSDAAFMLQPYQAGLSIQFKYKLKTNR